MPSSDVALSALRLERLTEDVLRDAERLGTSRPPPQGKSPGGDLFLDEVLASSALAGYPLERESGAAIVMRGIALGGHPLEVYEAVADYAEAARLVASADPRPLRPNTFLRADELPELHRRALRRTGRAPGAWRERNVAAVKSGLVPPPHWLVPREVSAFIDRLAGGPPSRVSQLAWVAAAHARLLRIQPFDGGNGRVARLVTNLLLRRLALPPAVFARQRAERYPHAIAAADSGDVGPLALLIAEALHETLTSLLGAAAREELRPLRDLADGRRLPALVKAAQRGRLRVVRRGARLYSTAEWLAEYERSSRR